VDHVEAVVQAGEGDVGLGRDGGRDRIRAAVEGERAIRLTASIHAEGEPVDPEHVALGQAERDASLKHDVRVVDADIVVADEVPL
jgi:hypothetical protein